VLKIKAAKASRAITTQDWFSWVVEVYVGDIVRRPAINNKTLYYTLYKREWET
jgi:hypothetical protein